MKHKKDLKYQFICSSCVYKYEFKLLRLGRWMFSFLLNFVENLGEILGLWKACIHYRHSIWPNYFEDQGIWDESDRRMCTLTHFLQYSFSSRVRCAEVSSSNDSMSFPYNFRLLRFTNGLNISRFISLFNCLQYDNSNPSRFNKIWIMFDL